jgi:hypothetical protein
MHDRSQSLSAVEFKLDFSPSYGSVWEKGDAIYGQEQDGSWYAMVCVEPRRLGPKGGVRGPATMAEMKALTWKGIRDAFKRVGFRPPVRHRG